MPPRQTVLRTPRVALLRQALDHLDAEAGARVGADPIAFVHAWAQPADQEVAAAIASGLAYGRVAAFWPVIQAILDRACQRGGPAAFVRGFDQEDAAVLAPLQYRWMRGPDLALWCATLGAALRVHGSLGAIAQAGFHSRDADIGPCLEHLVNTLRGLSVGEAARLGSPATDFAGLPRGFRYLLPRPSDGSACKRWCMLLRWMVRPPGDPRRGDGMDLGLWKLPPDRLVVPLDTHVGRLALLLGLTRRGDGSWRTATEITRQLARLDPTDPVRFDFALAHLGISGRCTVRQDGDQPPDPAVCGSCPLRGPCRIGGRVLQADETC